MSTTPEEDSDERHSMLESEEFRFIFNYLRLVLLGEIKEPERKENP